MAGQHFRGTYTQTIELTNPATQNPATITATGRVTTSGDGAYGASGFAWSVTNLGTIDSSAATGVLLGSGGSVTNGSAGSTGALTRLRRLGPFFVCRSR